MKKKTTDHLTLSDVSHLPRMMDVHPEIVLAFEAERARLRGRPVKVDKKIAVSAKIDPDILAEMDARGLVRNAFINQTLRAALFGAG